MHFIFTLFTVFQCSQLMYQFFIVTNIFIFIFDYFSTYTGCFKKVDMLIFLDKLPLVFFIAIYFVFKLYRKIDVHFKHSVIVNR